MKPKQTPQHSRYLWLFLLVFFFTCGKDNNNMTGPNGIVNITGLYAFVTELISNSCNFVSDERGVFLVEYMQSDNTLSIVDPESREVLLSGTITGNSYSLSRTNIDTLGRSKCILNTTISHTGMASADGVSGTDIFTYDFNEDPDCGQLTDCQFTRTFSGTKAEQPTADVSGTWNGTFQSSQFPTTSVTFILDQSDAYVSGTYDADSGGSGNVDGVVSGQDVIFVLNQTTFGCVGSFSGTATIIGNTLNFTFTGSDCLGSHSNGRGSATKQ